ncbi:hypothetical protein EDD11_001810 [Mortierella claussenii]|nr:hypothetical protein EDD11_001810 [Mortierella claussenii]
MTKIKPRLIARISCQECRRRKTRCNFDGQSQKCSTCQRIGTACIFSQKNGVVLDIDKVMEENNPHLVHQREKEQRAKERARLTSVPTPLSSTGSSATLMSSVPLAPASSSSASDMSIYSKSTPSSSLLSGSGGQYPNRHSRSNSTSSTALSRNGRSSPTEDLSSVMDRLQIDAFGIAPHTLRSFSQVAGDNDSTETSTGESSDADYSAEPFSSSAFHDDATDVTSDPIDSKPASMASTKGNSASNSSQQRQYSPSNDSSQQQYHHHHHRGHRSSRSRSVPLVDIQPDLIDLYFKHVHPFLLVLHKPSFFRRLHDPKDPVPDFLLAAMYAVASHYAPGREQDGRRYFQFWLSRLDDTLDKPRLSTIQALLMIIKYQEGVKHTGFYFRTYMYTQMVIVLARELQLHKTTPVNAKLDPESHEVRRRLFWAVFVLDQFLSVSQGRTMSFREVEPEADLPRTDNENPNDIEEIEVIENAVEYIKLVKIDHQALILVRKFLTKVVTPEETIPQGLFLHQAMLAWKANLPTRLQLAPNMSPHTPFVAMLHILYHACAIMIQRCYCEDPSVSHLEIAAVSRETCTVSATNITVIIDDLYTNYGMVPLTYPIRGCYFVIYCLIAAATIQVNDIRQGLNGPIMFKRSLSLLNHFLRKSTAVDIEREVELLKSSLDTVMDDRRSSSSSSLNATAAMSPLHYDHRPPLKPILPMSQKYGSKLTFGSSSVTPIRPRKISPKTPNSSSSNSGHMRSSSTVSTTTVSSRDQQMSDLTFNTSAEPGKGADNLTASGSSQSPGSSQFLDDDLDIQIKSSPSPDMSSRSISSALSISSNYDGSITTADGSINNDKSNNNNNTMPETFLRSVPTFAAPASLPSDFNAFAQAQQQALAGSGSQNPSPLMSLAQFFAFQQEQQRQQLQKQQLLQGGANLSSSSSSLDRLTAAQIQEQHFINQQRQMLQLQQQQHQQLLQQDPALYNTFLNNFSNLNNYQQLNSDQAQNELLSMLDSSMFNYSGTTGGNGTSNSNINPFALDAYSLQHQSQQQAHQQAGTAKQDDDSLSSSLNTKIPLEIPRTFHSSQQQQQQQQDDRQRTASSDDTLLGDAALARDHLKDTPSPESFPMLDMTNSFPSYLGTENVLPFGIRQALTDADKIFKFQAQAGLSTE